MLELFTEGSNSRFITSGPQQALETEFDGLQQAPSVSGSRHLLLFSKTKEPFNSSHKADPSAWGNDPVLKVTSSFPEHSKLSPHPVCKMNCSLKPGLSGRKGLRDPLDIPEAACYCPTGLNTENRALTHAAAPSHCWTKGLSLYPQTAQSKEQKVWDIWPLRDTWPLRSPVPWIR